MRGLVNRWRVFWQDFNCKEDWKFPELPPVQLQHSLDVAWSIVNRGEYIRAEWMWSRKPKLILGERRPGIRDPRFCSVTAFTDPSDWYPSDHSLVFHHAERHRPRRRAFHSLET